MPTEDNFDPLQCYVSEVIAICVLAPSLPPTNSTSVTNSTAQPPPVTLPPPLDIDCGSYCSTLDNSLDEYYCDVCHENYCYNDECSDSFPEFCSQCKSRRKRALEPEPEVDDDAYQNGGSKDNYNENFPRRRVRRGGIIKSSLSDSFKVVLPNFSEPFSCKEYFTNHRTDNDGIGYSCNAISNKLLSESRGFINVSCTPGEDPFNPCKNLLGDSDGLHVAIWLVTIFTFMGNGIVFFVFVGYSVIIRRTSQDLFTIHFLYFNLAMADLLMGFYLFIIAVVDADTKDEFFLIDIAWRTGHGCEFAGFCAITSTAVSVYVLLVITLERTYTIVGVFKHKQKLTHLQVYIIMAVGWIFGMFVAMLPLVGVSDYNTVAICLPFNVQGKEDLAYVVLLLLVTGIVFVIIAVCYTIIFQQICKNNKLSPVQVTNPRTADAKISIRIFVLVFTNFVCWFPIALIGLTAAFGKSLVHDLEFARWAVVFIFPINSCLNPFLYSLTSRTFRNHTILLLNKCGLCKNKALLIKNAQVGITPSYSSKTSKTSNVSGTNNAHILERLRSFSLVSQNSTVSLFSHLNRRNSIMSQTSSNDIQQMTILHSQARRGSSVSSSSREDVPNAQRGSSSFGGSGDSILSTSFNNVGFISTARTEIAGEALSHPGARPKISTTSLGAVPEEVEIQIEAIVDEDVVEINPAYQEEGEGVEEDSQLRKWDLQGEDREERDVHRREMVSNLSSSTNHYQLNLRKSISRKREMETGLPSTSHYSCKSL